MAWEAAAGVDVAEVAPTEEGGASAEGFVHSMRGYADGQDDADGDDGDGATDSADAGLSRDELARASGEALLRVRAARRTGAAYKRA